MFPARSYTMPKSHEAYNVNSENKYSFPDLHARVATSNSMHIGKLAEYSDEMDRLTPVQLDDSRVFIAPDNMDVKRLVRANGSILQGNQTVIIKYEPEGRVMRAWPMDERVNSRLVDHSMLADDNKPDLGFNGVEYAGEISPKDGRFEFPEREIVAETGHYKVPRSDLVGHGEEYETLSTERYDEVEQLSEEYTANFYNLFHEVSDQKPDPRIIDMSIATERGFGHETLSDELGAEYFPSYS